jgi:hypothetical protein
VSCIRLFTDEYGDSHLEEIGFEISPVDYAPQAPPLGLSEPVVTTSADLLHVGRRSRGVDERGRVNNPEARGSPAYGGYDWEKAMVRGRFHSV